MTDLQARWMVGIFSVLVGAAGWFYMFYSTAAHKLAAIEHPQINRKRIVLRRVGGSIMILLAATFYVGCDALFRHEIRLFAAMAFCMLALMAGLLAFALVDLRLTRKLRNRPPKDD